MSDFIYCQSEIEEGEMCKTQCDHCRAYYGVLEEYHRGFLPNDISRCANERCERKMRCKRYLDCLPFETYWYNDFNEKDCEFFINYGVDTQEPLQNSSKISKE